MRRRDFIASTLAASCLPLASVRPARAAAPQGRQVLELRRWVIETEAQQQLVDRFLESALVPALQRLNVAPIGVFHETGEQATRNAYLLTQYDSLDNWASLPERLVQDGAFVEQARDYLHTPKTQPAYQRVESQLMRAFENFPKIETPLSGDRVLEMRVYESHNELKGKLKVEMFNQHEFDIFARVGLHGVFFGESIAGANLPNLTYMVAHQDMAAHDRAWKAFSEDPTWVKVREMERYQDTVSHIVKIYLKPTAYSQV